MYLASESEGSKAKREATNVGFTPDVIGSLRTEGY